MSIQNQGEEVPPTTRLLTVLKAKTTDLVAVKHDKFANLHLMIQHRKERKMLAITSDVSIEKLKEMCFVSISYERSFIVMRMIFLSAISYEYRRCLDLKRLTQCFTTMAWKWQMEK